MITGLFMGWTDSVNKAWYPIQKMSKNADGYHTCYVNGVFAAIDASANMQLLFKTHIPHFNFYDNKSVAKIN